MVGLPPQVAIGSWGSTTPVAHNYNWEWERPGLSITPACGSRKYNPEWDRVVGIPERWDIIPTRHARRFSRPCRRCFPDSGGEW